MSFEQFMREIIREEARSVINEIITPVELYPLLPHIATTNEIAEVMRVSDEVIRRMCDEGLPHTHAGRELRFSKAMLIEWTVSGKRYNCEICAEKSGRQSPPTKEINLPSAVRVPEEGLRLSNKTSKKLARLAE